MLPVVFEPHCRNVVPDVACRCGAAWTTVGQRVLNRNQGRLPQPQLAHDLLISGLRERTQRSRPQSWRQNSSREGPRTNRIRVPLSDVSSLFRCRVMQLSHEVWRCLCDLLRNDRRTETPGELAGPRLSVPIEPSRDHMRPHLLQSAEDQSQSGVRRPNSRTQAN